MAETGVISREPRKAAPRRSGLFQAAVASGIGTSLVVVPVLGLVTLLLMLPLIGSTGVYWTVWDAIEGVVYTQAFAVPYAVLPLIGVGFAAAWWSRQRSSTAMMGIGARVLLVAAIVLASWAWFATTVMIVRQTFSFDSIPEGLVNFGLTTPDLWDSLVVIGLSCLIGLAVVNLGVMFDETGSRPAQASPSTVNSNPPTDQARVGTKTCPSCESAVPSAAFECASCGWHFDADRRPRQSTRTNNLAAASLVLGLLWLWGIGSILAIVGGRRALSQIRSSSGSQGGTAFASVGVILGWLGIAGAVILLAVIHWS